MDRIGWHTVTRRLLIVCLTLGAVLMLVACGGDSEARPAIRGPVPQEAQVISVAQEIFPEVHPGVFGACPLHVMDAGCPMTMRLQDRLLEAKISICRCQNGSSTREIEVDAYPGGAVAHVIMYEGRVTYNLIMVMDDGALLVGDVTCGGDARTSIYNDPVGPC
jgi:hypothetical protein